MRLTKWKWFRTNRRLYRVNNKISISDLTWKLGQLEDLMEKYEFETIEDLDEYLFNKTPMIYKNGKWQRIKE